LVVIVLVILLILLLLPAMRSSRASSSDIITQYVKALQTNDPKTLMRLTHDTEREIANIKAKNPQALWQNLILQHQVDLARETARRLDEQIVSLFTPGASWKISES